MLLRIRDLDPHILVQGHLLMPSLAIQIESFSLLVHLNEFSFLVRLVRGAAILANPFTNFL